MKFLSHSRDARQSDGVAPTKETAAVNPAADSCIKAKRVLVSSINDAMSDHSAKISALYLVRAMDLGNPPLNGFSEGAFIAAGKVKGGDSDGDAAAWVVDKEMTTTGGGAALAIDDASKNISELGTGIGEGSAPADYMDAAKNSSAYNAAIKCVG